MSKQEYTQKKVSSQSLPNQVPNPFAPRPFGIQTQVEQASSQEQQEKIALDAQEEQAKPFGRKSADIPVNPPNNLQPIPMIQAQLINQQSNNFSHPFQQTANSIQLQPRKHSADFIPAINKTGMTTPSLQKDESMDDSEDHSEFDSNQFRISGKAPDRKIELVSRTKRKGKVVYFAKGIVKGFEGNNPKIEMYDAPISLGDWYPSVTHINGMNVTPKAGIHSAAALQEAVNEAIGGKDDVALEPDAIDVLYTYSAQRGGLKADLVDCIKGKLGVQDQATVNQENIMYDAVKSKNRVTVSAHSRGTIKTDNAVRNVHEKLENEYYAVIKAQEYKALLKQCENDFSLGLSGMYPEEIAEYIIRVTAAKTAQEDMNKYIQLIYAGNAVSFPSSLIKVEMFVGGLDLVSMGVGSYSKAGQKLYSFFGGGGGKGSQVKNSGWKKGHGFDENYLPDVSESIAKDLKNRPQKSEK